MMVTNSTVCARFYHLVHLPKGHFLLKFESPTAKLRQRSRLRVQMRGDGEGETARTIDE